MRSGMLDQLWTSIADAGRDLVRGRLGGRRRPSIERPVPRPALDQGRGVRRGAGSRAGRCLRGHGRERSGWASSPCWRRTTMPTRRGSWPPSRPIASEPAPAAVQALRRACEAPRHELFRRMNIGPGRHTGDRRPARAAAGPTAGPIPSWRRSTPTCTTCSAAGSIPGFLTFTRIDWNSPAALLEKFLRYEKVHRMRALEDLKRRLAADRRCFAFFHPALPDEPLIFVEVALVDGMADRDPAADRPRCAGAATRPPPIPRSSTRSTTAWRACAASRSATS